MTYAIIELKPGAYLELLREQLPREVKDSWELFAAGVLCEAYATPSPRSLRGSIAATAWSPLVGDPSRAAQLKHVRTQFCL